MKSLCPPVFLSTTTQKFMETNNDGRSFLDRRSQSIHYIKLIDFQQSIIIYRFLQ